MFKRPRPSSPSPSSAHLATIHRAHLDFDFDPVCSVSLSSRNVHVCLVCGRFFMGRGPDSPLMQHVLQTQHGICMALATQVAYEMPNNQVVEDASLDEVRFNMKPVYGEKEIQEMVMGVSPLTYRLDVHGATYLPGIVGMGMNDKTDFVIAVVQCLLRVRKLSAFFLDRRNWETCSSSVTRAFGELVCQLWNPKRFKSTVSPHAFLQAISNVSQKRFHIGVRSDASLFLAWLLDELHAGLSSHGKGDSIVHECFRGEITVYTTTVELKREFAMRQPKIERAGPQVGGGDDDVGTTTTTTTTEHQQLGSATTAIVKNSTTVTVPFNYLTLDLPTKSIFTHEMADSNTTTSIIPTTTLLNLLSKYDGVTITETPLPGGRIEKKRYHVTRYPDVCIFLLKRFTRNNFFVEKNPCVVTLPVNALELGSRTFDLVGNVTHENTVMGGEKDPIATGIYKANVRQRAIPDDVWFEAHEMTVKETMSQLVAISETQLAFYQRTM